MFEKSCHGWSIRNFFLFSVDSHDGRKYNSFYTPRRRNDAALCYAYGVIENKKSEVFYRHAVALEPK